MRRITVCLVADFCVVAGCHPEPVAQFRGVPYLKGVDTAQDVQAAGRLDVPLDGPSDSMGARALVRRLATTDPAKGWDKVRLDHDFEVTAYAARDDGSVVVLRQAVIALIGEPAVVRMIDPTAAGAVAWTQRVYAPSDVPHVGSVHALGFSPDGEYVACVFLMGVDFLDASDGSVVQAIVTPGRFVQSVEWGRVDGRAAFRILLDESWGEWRTVERDARFVEGGSAGDARKPGSRKPGGAGESAVTGPSRTE